MIAVIRISGLVEIRKDFAETLDRLLLKKKYNCIVMQEKPELLGMLKKTENFVAYGSIDKGMLAKLIEKRGETIKNAGGKSGKEKKEDSIDGEKAADSIIKGKKLQELGIKPVFRLHPPRGGIKSKVHFPKGALGNHKENINKLIERML
ncbi:uL30 family ribosomal protein [Candidatus Pacearchaeota archaeon]|nr:uL30 family ribosomal protein [Candidatus Pacearchaeota archaeon]